MGQLSHTAVFVMCAAALAGGLYTLSVALDGTTPAGGADEFAVVEELIETIGDPLALIPLLLAAGVVMAVASGRL